MAPLIVLVWMPEALALVASRAVCSACKCGWWRSPAAQQEGQEFRSLPVLRGKAYTVVPRKTKFSFHSVRISQGCREDGHLFWFE